MKFFRLIRKLAAVFSAVHAKAHKVLHLPAPRFGNRPQDADSNRMLFWILHAR
ncbi:MAG: hypothetical protein JO233_05485 [Candidatus Eremiobacteraeota bacterium]|nr:hypothetical protein [Candidatus Eremiobacteraeota bacterium]